MERCRVVAALVNSLYSYYWDVVHDWDLGHAQAAYPFLRDTLLFRAGPRLYYAALAANFLLRLTWWFKLVWPVPVSEELR
jgi:hypothetical protein